MAAITVYGASWCPDCKRSKQFLGEQRVPYEWVDIEENADGLAFVEELQGGGRSIPTIIFEDGSHLIEPTNEELARKLGLSMQAQCDLYDVVIVGGGPAGLAAGIYAAREGMETLVVDRSSLGGHAGLTERIDNYPGFPKGIAGAELADRFVQQARSQGVELLEAVAVQGLHDDAGDVRVEVSTGRPLAGHAVILTPGSSYRRLDVPGEESLIGAGIHFCATCDGPFYKGAEELLVVGGGNSALEEALFLAQFAERIRIVARGELGASLVIQDRVRDDPRITVHTGTRITAFTGDSRVSAVEAEDSDGATQTWHPAGVFIFVGLDPNTAFLRGAIDLDERGFIQTDDALGTSLPAVFAGGDARAGSTKQLGAAVGEGITAFLSTRRYLERHGHTSHPTGND